MHLVVSLGSHGYPKSKRSQIDKTLPVSLDLEIAAAASLLIFEMEVKIYQASEVVWILV